MALRIPVSQEDIGGNLVSIASQGLYSDPRDVIREFAQNGVDAGASQITVRFAGLNVAVIDDGDGMGFEEMKKARRFGRSTKSANTHVGFRGIGIYAGFHLSERLIFVSQKANDTKRWTLTFEFGNMRRTLETYAGQDDKTETALGRLIYDNTTIYSEALTADQISPRGRTIALLESLSPEAYGEFSDLDRLRDYLRTELPVPIDDDFKYKAQVDKFLATHLDYATVEVRLLNIDTTTDERIVRSFGKVSGLPLFPPVFKTATWPGADGKTVAVIWACMSDRKTLGADAGLFLKKRGFTIGDGKEMLDKFQARKQVYPWFVGEIHVTDPNVNANASREAFENTAAYRNLLSALDVPLKELLQEAVDHASRARASDLVRAIIVDLPKHFPTPLSDLSTHAEILSMYEKMVAFKSRFDAARVPLKDLTYKKIRADKVFYLNLVEQERERLRVLLEHSNASGDATEIEPESRRKTSPMNPFGSKRNDNGKGGTLSLIRALRQDARCLDDAATQDGR